MSDSRYPRQLNERQKQLLEGMTGQSSQVVPPAQEVPRGRAMDLDLSDYLRQQALQNRLLEEAKRQQELAAQQAPPSRFQRLKQMAPPAPPQQGAIELSEDPEEMQRQIEAARLSSK